MAWDKAQYVLDVKAAFDRSKTDSVSGTAENTVRQNFADDLANALDVAIGTLDVTIPIATVSQGASPSVVVNPAPIELTNSVS